MECSKTADCEIVLILGQLGSGKTTLVKHMLSHSDRKMAFLQNQFSSEMGIEAPFLTDPQGKPFTKLQQLPNGCLCCSSTGDTMLAVTSLLQSYPDIQVLLVEANGLADPIRAVQMFWVDEGQRTGARLGYVVALIGKFQGTAQDAVAVADTVVINYCDKRSQEQQQQLSDRIAQLNPACNILRTSHGQISLSSILQQPRLQHLPSHQARQQQQHTHAHQHSHSAYSSILLKNLTMSMQQLMPVLQDLHWQCREDYEVVRSKGVFGWGGVGYSLQGVGSVFQFNQEKQYHGDNRVLLIGRNVQLAKPLFH